MMAYASQVYVIYTSLVLHNERTNVSDVHILLVNISA